MFKKPPIIYKNQFNHTIDHATEFEKLRLLNMGCPDFDDDPAAAGDTDKHGRYSKRSLAEGQIMTGVDMGSFRGNGEKVK